MGMPQSVQENPVVYEQKFRPRNLNAEIGEEEKNKLRVVSSVKFLLKFLKGISPILESVLKF